MKITITAENDDDKKLLPDGEVVYEGVPRCVIVMGANDKWLHATGNVDMVRADLGRADQHFGQVAMIGAVQQAIAEMNKLASDRQRTAALMNATGKRMS